MKDIKIEIKTQTSEGCQPSLDSYGTNVPQNDEVGEWPQNDGVGEWSQNDEVGEWVQNDGVEEWSQNDKTGYIPNTTHTEELSPSCHTEELSPICHTEVHFLSCHTEELFLSCHTEERSDVSIHRYRNTITKFRGHINPHGFSRPEGLRMTTCTVSESGRSMIEILGVLAVIGVLSIGGISGYRFAMDKQKANQLISDVNFKAVLCSTEVLSENYNKNTCGEETLSSEFGLNATYNLSQKIISIKTGNISKSICKKVVDMNWKLPTSVKRGEDILTMDNCEDTNELTFEFESNLSQNLFRKEPTPAIPCGGISCKQNEYCSNDTCVCQYPCGGSCCPEGTYCTSTTSDYSDFSCEPKEEGTCENNCPTTSWQNGAVSVEYCPSQSGRTCTEPKLGTTCQTATLNCGTINDKKYCYSTDDVDWWNAKSRCDSLKMRLPNKDELIAYRDLSLYYVWTSTLTDACKAYAANASGSDGMPLERYDNFGVVKMLCVE